MVALLSQIPQVPSDATRELRHRENRARIKAIGARFKKAPPLIEAAWRNEARDAREARLELESPAFGATGCREGRHIGHMLDTDKMDRAGGYWSTVATCSACLGTVHRAEFVGGAR